jgi:hypothetical protein
VFRIRDILVPYRTDPDADPDLQLLTSDKRMRIRTKIFSDFEDAKKIIFFIFLNVFINEI